MKKLLLAGVLSLFGICQSKAAVEIIGSNDTFFTGKINYTVESEACDVIHCGKFNGRTLFLKTAEADGNRFIIAFGGDINDTIGFRGKTIGNGAEVNGVINMPVTSAFFQEINEDKTPIPVRSDSKCLLYVSGNTFSKLTCDVHPAQSHVVMEWTNTDLPQDKKD